MAGTSDSPDVLVVGAGIIGLAVAWRARRQGMRVTVLERGLAGGGTSRVAAGMLAPVSEAEFGEGASSNPRDRLRARYETYCPCPADGERDHMVDLVGGGAIEICVEHPCLLGGRRVPMRLRIAA